MLHIGTSGCNDPERKWLFYPGDLAPFLHVAGGLGDRAAPLLVRLPPNLESDPPRPEAFLGLLPAGTRAAFEFRHPSRLADDTLTLRRARNVASCVADSERMDTPAVLTADCAYFRLRAGGYEADDIAARADTIAETTAGCRDVFVDIKHEEAGTGPVFAAMLHAPLTGSR